MVQGFQYMLPVLLLEITLHFQPQPCQRSGSRIVFDPVGIGFSADRPEIHKLLEVDFFPIGKQKFFHSFPDTGGFHLYLLGR